jgi:hypothetical protein
MWHFPDPLHVIISLLQLWKDIENVYEMEKFITSNRVYWELVLISKHINKSLVE